MYAMLRRLHGPGDPRRTIGRIAADVIPPSFREELSERR
jgi:hypothetical protein